MTEQEEWERSVERYQIKNRLHAVLLAPTVDPYIPYSVLLAIFENRLVEDDWWSTVKGINTGVEK